MNNIDAITTLARYEGRNLKPDKSNYTQVPYFTCIDGKITSMENYKYHDNAQRMLAFSDILNKNVLPNLSTKLNGTFGIELHDSNSYLDNEIDYDGVLVWARNKYDKTSILMPDIYQYTNYLSSEQYVDNVQYKIPKVGFYGTTTGSRDPFKNLRIGTCLWALDRDFVDCYITNIAQMSIDDFKKISRHGDITHKYVQMAEQFKYKYILDIPGNTYSWNRVPIVMQSNSLLFKMPCDDRAWYYPLMHPGEHYVEVDKNNMHSKFMYYENNPKEYNFIVENAKKFVTNYLKTTHAYLYMAAMIEESVFWNKR